MEETSGVKQDGLLEVVAILSKNVDSLENKVFGGGVEKAAGGGLPTSSNKIAQAIQIIREVNEKILKVREGLIL